VDDEEATRKLIVDLLSQKGHQCSTASNGLEALDKIMGTKFDAVITDVVMPGMDGIALTKELSKHNQNLPVMVITGYTRIFRNWPLPQAGFIKAVRFEFLIHLV
jgi:CheY-like chemotaxis protein